MIAFLSASGRSPATHSCTSAGVSAVNSSMTPFLRPTSNVLGFVSMTLTLSMLLFSTTPSRACCCSLL